MRDKLSHKDFPRYCLLWEYPLVQKKTHRRTQFPIHHTKALAQRAFPSCGSRRDDVPRHEVQGLFCNWEKKSLTINIYASCGESGDVVPSSATASLLVLFLADISSALRS